MPGKTRDQINHSIPGSQRWRSRPLRPGDWVEVRSFAEIATTLDERGELDNLPFMPEMLHYCGRQFEVAKRANKTCDEAAGGTIRKLKDTVHLKEVRCSGEAHGGCDAGCLMFWKEQWLTRVAPADPREGPEFEYAEQGLAGNRQLRARKMLETINHEARYHDALSEAGKELFSCQSTEVSRFSKPLPWWDLRQYVGDFCTGNVPIGEFFSGLFIGMYNKVQDVLGGTMFGFVCGANVKTPHATLDLSPGDLVQVKSKSEVVSTLDNRGKNRGLSFPPVMVPYCGRQFRVLRRVMNVINPRTRELVSMGGKCVILDGVVCSGKIKRFCPRMVYQYWRDIWLTKVEEPGSVGVRGEDPARNQTPVAVQAAPFAQACAPVNRASLERARDDIRGKRSVEPSTETS